MVSQRAAALVVFIGVVLMGLAFILVIRSHLRERRWEREGEDATHFLKNLSRNGEKDALKGAEAVVIEKENETTYLNEPAKSAKVSIHPGNHPQHQIIKRLIENRRKRREVVAKIATTVRGILDYGGRRYWMKNWRIVDDHLTAEFINSHGEKMGVFKLLGRNESVITGEIHLAEGGMRRIFDVFIPVNHPNFTKVLLAIRESKPSSRELTVAAIDRTFSNATEVSPVARR